jgi:hypothetical protein
MFAESTNSSARGNTSTATRSFPNNSSLILCFAAHGTSVDEQLRIAAWSTSPQWRAYGPDEDGEDSVFLGRVHSRKPSQARGGRGQRPVFPLSPLACLEGALFTVT